MSFDSAFETFGIPGVIAFGLGYVAYKIHQNYIFSIASYDILNKYGNKSIGCFPLVDILKYKVWDRYVNGMKVVKPLNLFEYNKNFLFLLDNKPVIKRISAILGNCIQLHSASARLSSPGSKNQNWHRDGHWPVDPNGTPIGSIPGQINCGYYLDPLTEKNGPIAIVPGSQKALFKPPKKDFEFPDQKIIYAKPGQAIIFNGWIYHRGLGNKSKSNRRVCLICYQNSWMKSRETFDGPIISKIKKSGSSLQKLLLGSVNKW